MPKTTTISPDEPISGGYLPVPDFSDVKGGSSSTAPPPATAKSAAKGGTGSLNLPITQLPPSKTIAATAQLSSETITTPGGIEADVLRFNSDVEEVTLDSDYYQSSQPFLNQFSLQWAKGVDEITIKSEEKPVSGPRTLGAPELPVSEMKTTALVATYAKTGAALQDDTLDPIAPNHFLGLRLKRYMNGVGEFTLTLFDPQWDAVEKKIIKSKGHFKFSYGNFASDRPAAKSPVYEAKAFTYKVDFGMEGSTITINGFTTGYSLTFAKTSKALNLKGEIISDIVADICKAFGPDYVPVIEPTAPVKSREGIGSTDEVNRFFNLTGESYAKVIINHLVKYAINKDGQGNYGFFIRVNKEGKKEFHFHTMNYDPKEKASSLAKVGEGNIIPVGRTIGISVNQGANVAKSSIKSIPGFTKFRSKNSPLISFTPSWSMSVVQLTGGGGTVSAIIDMTTKGISVENVNMNSNPQKFDGKGQITLFDVVDYLPEGLKSDDVLKAFKYINSPARNTGQNSAIVKADFSRNYPGGVKATLEIVGSPNFYLTQKIAVFIFKPQMDNILASLSNVHWISGFFRIIGIVDNITAGKYTTTFELISDGRSLVTLDKIKTLQG